MSDFHQISSKKNEDNVLFLLAFYIVQLYFKVICVVLGVPYLSMYCGIRLSICMYMW